MAKYLNLAVVMLLALLVSCNHNDEPPLEVNLSVAEQYMPATTVFDADDKEFLDKVKPYADKTFVINSLAELNEDPFGFSNAYKGIDFDEYTLLVAYCLKDSFAILVKKLPANADIRIWKSIGALNWDWE